MAEHRRPNGRPSTHSDRTAPDFARLGVPRELCSLLRDDGIVEPFPIQSMTLRDSLRGRDVLGRGRTGSGKTLAFALPVVARIAASDSVRAERRPRALILAPTRELVRQIHDTVRPLAQRLGLTTTTVIGGVPAGSQISALRRGVDIVVACPGRLEDLQGSKHVDLSHVEITVLDEADHMADLGFLPGVTRILESTPRDSQRLLFSATLDNAVDGLVRRFLRNPVIHHADDETSPVETIDHHVLHVNQADRLAVIIDLTAARGRTVVFTRTKHRARQLTRQLVTAGVPAVEMHGDLTQGARTRNLAAFSEGRATTLVATDIAARGIHIDDIRLVVHADPPVEHKSYLHRSGRTARAGATGTVVTIATEEQRAAVRTLNRKAGISPTVTALGPGHDLLRQLAPAGRVTGDRPKVATAPRPAERNDSAPRSQRRRGPAGRPAGRPGERSSGSPRGKGGHKGRPPRRKRASSR